MDLDPTGLTEIKTRRGVVEMPNQHLLMVWQELLDIDALTSNKYGVTTETLRWVCASYALRHEGSDHTAWALYFGVTPYLTEYVNKEGRTYWYIPREGKGWHPFDAKFQAVREDVIEHLGTRIKGESIKTIASAVGVSASYVTRVLRQLEHEGVIKATASRAGTLWSAP